MNPETLAAYPRRLTINRNSAYSPPKWAEDLLSGLPSFDTRQCTAGIVAVLDGEPWTKQAFRERAAPSIKAQKEAEDPAKSQTEKEEILVKSQEENAKLLFERIRQYAFAGQTSTAAIPAPPCEQQRAFQPIYGNGPATQYQHTFEQP